MFGCLFKRFCTSTFASFYPTHRISGLSFRYLHHSPYFTAEIPSTVTCNTQHQNDVVSTSMRRDHVASTFIRRHFNVVCPLGIVSRLFGKMGDMLFARPASIWSENEHVVWTCTSNYFLCATPPTGFNNWSFWNVAGIFYMVWIYACGLDILLTLMFWHCNLGTFLT